jgi:hypothetical protein
MNVKLFVHYLPLLRVPRYELALKGLGDDFEEIITKRTTALKRGKPLAADDLPETLRDLFADYEFSNIELLSTFFWSEPKKLDQGWGFADMSEVNIVVAPSGQIEAYVAHPIRGMPGATDCLGVLAKDLESYLEGLFYAQFNKTHLIPGFPDGDPILFEKTVLVAKHCALIAGGYEYFDFWAGILGLPHADRMPE